MCSNKFNTEKIDKEIQLLEITEEEYLIIMLILYVFFHISHSSDLCLM